MVFSRSTNAPPQIKRISFVSICRSFTWNLGTWDHNSVVQDRIHDIGWIKMNWWQVWFLNFNIEVEAFCIRYKIHTVQSCPQSIHKFLLRVGRSWQWNNLWIWEWALKLIVQTGGWLWPQKTCIRRRLYCFHWKS